MSELPDWSTIEASFRSGTASLREIAGEHGVTEGAIRARAKKGVWVRATDLTRCVEPRITDLEHKVEALEGLVKEMGELLVDMVRLNFGNLQQMRAVSNRRPTRWG